jgi:nucleoside-diphosphate-sugar epimerase
MKILVTGGGGFLGTEICKQLLASGHQVISLQRSFSKTLESMGILQIQADLAVNESLNQSLNQVHDVEAVFHVAAKAGVWGSFESYYTANVVATENILIWSKNHRVKYFIYTSTPSVIFTKESVENADESIPYPEWFLTFYGQTKAKAEQMILSSQKDNFQVISLRPHLVFGAGDPHFVPRIIARAKANRLVQVGGGHNLVDVIHVSNAAYAHICALNYLMESPSHGGRAYFYWARTPCTFMVVYQ